METITPIGVTDFRNTQLPFGIKAKDRSGHIYCLGKTGAGKSTLLLNMAISDIINNNGSVVVLDPHGDLANTILNYISPKRIKDVVYVDVTNKEYSFAFNPLNNIVQEERFLIASNLVLVFKKLWRDSWGPRLEHILRNTIYSLTFYPNATLLDIVPVLTDSIYRQGVIHHIKDNTLIRFWRNEFEPLSTQQKAEFTASIINKIGILNTHPILKAILGAKKSKFNLKALFTQKKIFIANLAKGSIGEAGTSLLGSLLLTSIQSLALQQHGVLESQRQPVFLYLDEVHSFMTESFVDMLSESRKYGLCLFLTHQYTEQIEPSILQGILGNVGTIIAFRIGTTDAEIMAKEFYPTFTVDDCINLPRYHIYLKLLIDSSTSKPFSAKTLGLRHVAYYCSEYISANCIQQYYNANWYTSLVNNKVSFEQQCNNDRVNIPTQERLDFG
jgi:hypothetical protein